MNPSSERNLPAGEPQEGLWAFFEGRFHTLFWHKKNRHMDHVTWFQEIGLPDFGHDFDRVTRGRMLWDWHQEHYVLTFYGMRQMPNHLYQLVNRTFNSENKRVVEREAATQWSKNF